MAERKQPEGRPLAARLVGPTLLVLAVSLILYGSPVPRLSEELYLPLVRRVADPSYLRGDWTFSGSFGEHWLFDHLFSPLAGAVSISTFGWIGRLVSWPVLGLLLIRLGNRLGLSPWSAAAAVSLWLVEQPVVHRRRVDDRHVRGEDGRVHLPARGAPRGDLQAGAARPRARSGSR